MQETINKSNIISNDRGEYCNVGNILEKRRLKAEKNFQGEIFYLIYKVATTCKI